MQDVKGLLKPSCFLNPILQEKPGYSAVLTVLKISREEALAWLPHAAPRPLAHPHQHFGVTHTCFPRPAEPGTQLTSAVPQPWEELRSGAFIYLLSLLQGLGLCWA